MTTPAAGEGIGAPTATFTSRRIAWAATALLAGLLAAGGGARAAGEVTLRAKGGGLEVRGTVRAYDGIRYVIDTPLYGTMTFDATRIECVGEPCGKRVAPPPPVYERPDPTQPETIRIQAPVGLPQALLPALVRGYGSATGAKVAQIVGTAPDEIAFRLTRDDGALIGTIVVRRPPSAQTGADREPPHVIVTDRAPTAEDLRLLGGGPGAARNAVQELLLARDGLAVVVSPANPAVAVSIDNLARILSGQVTSWTELGVPGGRISVYASDRASGALAAAVDQLLRPRGLGLATTLIETGSEAEAVDSVVRDANGLAIASFASLQGAKALNIEGSCGLIARPKSFAAKSGEYPLSRRLTLLSPGAARLSLVRGLVRYAASAEAQATLAAIDLIDDAIVAAPLEAHTTRLAYALNAPANAYDADLIRQLLADLKGASRLDPVLRLTPGGELDGRARRELGGIIEFLVRPENAALQVFLAGFSDNDGKLQAGTAASARRATQARQALLAAAQGRIEPSRVTAKGYGPLAPIHCNDSSEHRLLNRRVEIWVRAL
jgi:phosphate transport system substrate-binding protein